jgi:hypothetical protein
LSRLCTLALGCLLDSFTRSLGRTASFVLLPFGSHARSFRVDEERDHHFRLSRLSRAVHPFGARTRSSSGQSILRSAFAFRVCSVLLTPQLHPRCFAITFWALTKRSRMPASWGARFELRDPLAVLALLFCAHLVAFAENLAMPCGSRNVSHAGASAFLPPAAFTHVRPSSNSRTFFGSVDTS